MPFDNVYQHSINKTLQTLDSIENLTTFSIYKTEKNLVSRGSVQGGAKISLHEKVEDFIIIKDERSTFTDIDAYLRGKIYKNSGSYTIGKNLIYLKMTNSLPEKAYTYTKYLYKSTEDPREIQQEPNSFVKVFFYTVSITYFIALSWLDWTCCIHPTILE